MMSDITAEDVRLRIAEKKDIDSLVKLLNRCYRSAEGWTNEAHLIGGIRTTATELQKMLENPDIYLFVFAHSEKNHQLLGCISVDFTSQNGKPTACIGTFAVVPELQGKGIGQVMLNAVETFAIRHASTKGIVELSMSILNHRPELLAYYQRRGYTLTGETLPFPIDGNHGSPKRQDVYLQTLVKPIKKN